MSTDHVALTLDGARIADHPSAMRWVPEPKKGPEAAQDAAWGVPGVGMGTYTVVVPLGRQIEETGDA